MDAVLGKRRVDSGLDRLQYRLLDQPVYHRRYPELTLPAIRLRYLHPEYGLRFVPALDIPIGLPSDGADWPRPSDLAARDFVGPRRSSVFLAPRRPVFAEETFDSGDALHRQLTGKGISRQSWGLRDRVLEVEFFVSAKGRSHRNPNPQCINAWGGIRPHPSATIGTKKLRDRHPCRCGRME